MIDATITPIVTSAISTVETALDLGRHAQPHRAVDPHRQGGGARSGGEARDHEIVEGEGEASNQPPIRAGAMIGR